MIDDAKEYLDFAFDKLVQDHKPENVGEVYHALLVAWIGQVSELCPGCARKLLRGARDEVVDQRERLGQGHWH